MAGAAAHGAPGEDGADFADQRAASLRRMFPHRVPARIATPPATVPAPPPVTVTAVPVPPAHKPRRWGLVLTGVLVALIAAGSVAAFRVVSAAPATPVGNPATEGFPVVAPPSFAPSSPAPLAGLQSAIRANVPPASAGSARTPHQAARSGGPAASTARSAAKGKPISAYSACSTASSVTFQATFAGTFSWHHVFIDADGDAATGYRGEEAAGLGADYLIEDDLLYRSTGAEWGWTEMAGVSPLVSRSGNTFRWRLRPGHGGEAAVFNGATEDTDSSTPVVRVKGC